MKTDSATIGLVEVKSKSLTLKAIVFKNDDILKLLEQQERNEPVLPVRDGGDVN